MDLIKSLFECYLFANRRYFDFWKWHQNMSCHSILDILIREHWLTFSTSLLTKINIQLFKYNGSVSWITECRQYKPIINALSFFMFHLATSKQPVCNMWDRFFAKGALDPQGSVCVSHLSVHADLTLSFHQVSLCVLRSMLLFVFLFLTMHCIFRRGSL